MSESGWAGRDWAFGVEVCVLALLGPQQPERVVGLQVSGKV